MRRGRAPSRERSGSGGPQWDDPNGQLPGTGIPGDGGDSLYRSSSLRRRRDASPVTGTVESVGQEGVGVVPERPSLFSSRIVHTSKKCLVEKSTTLTRRVVSCTA